jgi:chromosome segregation ATPase
VEQLRGEVTEVQGRWEALGEELEAKRRRLRLAEATVELAQRRQEEAAQTEEEEQSAGGWDGALHAGLGELVSQGAQASAAWDTM